VKRAGNKSPYGKEAEKQKAREQGVLMVMYLNEGHIPDSPSEPFLGKSIVMSVDWTPDGRWILAADDAGQIQFWDGNGQVQFILFAHSEPRK